MPSNHGAAVLILTLNEADTLPISLGSVRRYMDGIEVLVLDSNSSDDTEAVALSMGARVEKRAFSGYATQRNHGLKLLNSYDWVLMLDADEEITPEFAREFDDFVATAPASTEMAQFRRKDFFLNKWIRHSSGYPTWFGRVARPGKVRVEREINEEYICDGETASFETHLHHYPFAKGLVHWVDKHNRYSTAEAKILAEQKVGRVNPSELFGRDKSSRRRALKQIYMRVPFRPLAGFLYLYVIKLGFLDGRAGFQFCTLRFIYECLINLKRDEFSSDGCSDRS